jgi:hypothetical protein
MLVDELADYLEDVAHGTVATDICVGFLPAAPDTVTVLFSTGGPVPDARLGYDWPTFQVRTRGTNPRTAYDRLAAVYGLLHGLHAVTLGDIYLVDCVALQSAPVALGRDDAGRHEYTLNFRARVRNATTHRI